VNPYAIVSNAPAIGEAGCCLSCESSGALSGVSGIMRVVPDNPVTMRVGDQSIGGYLSSCRFICDSRPAAPFWAVLKHILIYGLIGGAVIALLELIEYQYLVLEHSVEIYGALIAALFAAFGIWLGLRITQVRERVVVREVAIPASSTFERNPGRIESLGITPRELEILELIASGLSNREIAEAIFVSENTVKTHSSRLFNKLGAKRRTQAVQLGKQAGLIP
jgi:DNA-binding CsgD family transcriptional regulator